MEMTYRSLDDKCVQDMMGSFWLWGWWFFLALPDRLSCPLFIYMVHFGFEFTFIENTHFMLDRRIIGCPLRSKLKIGGENAFL
jgi:hypothetical protein